MTKLQTDKNEKLIFFLLAQMWVDVARIGRALLMRPEHDDIVKQEEIGATHRCHIHVLFRFAIRFWRCRHDTSHHEETFVDCTTPLIVTSKLWVINLAKVVTRPSSIVVELATEAVLPIEHRRVGRWLMIYHDNNRLPYYDNPLLHYRLPLRVQVRNHFHHQRHRRRNRVDRLRFRAHRSH